MGKVEKLKKKDIKKTAKVYQKGLSMETPKSHCKIDKLIKILDKEVLCFVHKTNNKIDGLVSFYFKNKNIIIDFICAIKQGRGIGTKLMKRLANYASRKKVKHIDSNIIVKNKKAYNFYKKCGFKKYSKKRSLVRAKSQEIIKVLK